FLSCYLSVVFAFFFVYCSGAHRALHSFPTRRSSDLGRPSARPAGPGGIVFVCSGHGSQWAGMTRSLLQTEPVFRARLEECAAAIDRKSTRLNSSHEWISYAVFCLKKKKK